VRFWVDTGAEPALGTEVEICMQRCGPHGFRGTFSRAILGAQDYFLYRLALLAAPEARWVLTIRDLDHGIELLRDGDDIALGKTWLTGTCPLEEERASTDESGAGAAARDCGAVVSLEDYRRASTKDELGLP
jgi:hypothetical protein